MNFPRTVRFEETGEQRVVTRSCLICHIEAEDEFVVSPGGLAHAANEFGDTDCGLDATRDGWWWPL